MIEETSKLHSNSCNYCKFWIKKWDGFPPVMGVPSRESMGECHRYSPEPGVGTAQVTVAWPVTRNYDFCGDFRD